MSSKKDNGYGIWWQKDDIFAKVDEPVIEEPCINISNLTGIEKRDFWERNKTNDAFVGFLEDPFLKDLKELFGDIEIEFPLSQVEVAK